MARLCSARRRCMRTRSMRAHLTSLTLILVITTSGQGGVSRVRRRAGFFFFLPTPLSPLCSFCLVASWPAAAATSGR